MTKIELYAPVEIHVEELIDSMDREQLFEFVLAIDLAQADAEFTENLIIRLCKSLKSDLSEDEWKPYEQFLESFKN